MIKYVKVNNQFTQELPHNRKFLEWINKDIKINRNYDVPYLAGYSENWTTKQHVVYVDRHLKEIMNYKGKKVDVIDFLIVHESVEKFLISEYKWHYAKAHHIASHFECLTLRKHNINWWDYSRFLRPQIKTAYSEKLTHVPPDLDLTPYRDESEKKIIREIMAGRRHINKKRDKEETHHIDSKDFINVENHDEDLFKDMLMETIQEIGLK